MGGGNYDHDTYTSSRSSRRASGTPDFAYTAKAAVTKEIHPTLDPKRINTKPFKQLESRDSPDHPESNAVMLFFDVTGSNVDNARVAQGKLNELMALLGKYLPDPQVAIGANDDFKASVGNLGAIQISDYESDNRIDESIRNIWLVGDGGGNDGESYALALYLAARKTVLDCAEKRNRKGYFFMYADEPIYSVAHHDSYHHKPIVSKDEVKAVFGDDLESDIPLAQIIEELKVLHHVFLMWPTKNGFAHARNQYVELFGPECVLDLQDPSLICELVASVVGMNEQKVSPSGAIDDLVSVGVSHSTATEVVGAASNALVVAGSQATSLSRGIPVGGAQRL